MTYKEVPLVSGLRQIGGSYSPQELSPREDRTRHPVPGMGFSTAVYHSVFYHSLNDSEFWVGKNLRPSREPLSPCSMFMENEIFLPRKMGCSPSMP